MASKIFPAVLALVLFSISDADKYTGTTKGLKRIFLGRCFEYLDRYQDLGMLDQPVPKGNEEKFCNNILNIFLKAFASKDPCSLTERDYVAFFDATGNTPIIDKILFWSKHEPLSLLISNHGKRAIVLADTLPGFLVTNLNWCGEVNGKNPDGINFIKCPVCNPNDEEGKREPFEVFWGIASKRFAMRAKGIVHHLVSGTVGKGAAYNKKTFFYKHELPSIPMAAVTKFRVIVANAPTATVHETCGTESIKTLQNDIKAKWNNKDPECIVNPSLVMHLMCADNPNAPECVRANPYKEF